MYFNAIAIGKLLVLRHSKISAKTAQSNDVRLTSGRHRGILRLCENFSRLPLCEEKRFIKYHANEKHCYTSNDIVKLVGLLSRLSFVDMFYVSSCMNKL